MMKKWLVSLWYVLVFLLPIQTTIIFLQKQLGQLPGIWQYGVISVYATDIIACGLLLTAGIIFFKDRRWAVWRQWEYLKIFWPLFFILVFSFGSILWSSDWMVSLQTAFRLLLGIFILLVACSADFSKRISMYVWWGSAVLQALLAWGQFIFQSVTEFKWFGMSAHAPWILGDAVVEGKMGRILRAYGTLPHPNILAVFLAIGLVCGAVLFLTAKSFGERMWLLLGTAIMLIGLIVSFGRGAWIALVLSFVIVLSYSVRRHTRIILVEKENQIKIFCFTMLVIIGACGISLAPYIATRAGLGGWTRIEQRSIDEREDYLVGAWHAITSRPFLGSGVGVSTLDEYNDSRSNHAMPVYTYQPVHNIYILMFVELGVLGGLTFLWFLIVMSRLLIRAFDSVSIAGEYLYNIGAVMIFIVLLGAGIVDHFFLTLHAGIFIWWAGLSMAMILISKKNVSR